MMNHILKTPGVEVINDRDFETFVEKSVYEVATDEACSAGYENL